MTHVTEGVPEGQYPSPGNAFGGLYHCYSCNKKIDIATGECDSCKKKYWERQARENPRPGNIN